MSSKLEFLSLRPSHNNGAITRLGFPTCLLFSQENKARWLEDWGQRDCTLDVVPYQPLTRCFRFPWFERDGKRIGPTFGRQIVSSRAGFGGDDIKPCHTIGGFPIRAFPITELYRRILRLIDECEKDACLRCFFVCNLEWDGGKLYSRFPKYRPENAEVQPTSITELTTFAFAVVAKRKNQ